MNKVVLEKYNITFYTKKDGRNQIDCSNPIASYMYIWRTMDMVDEFLADIDLCLNGRLDELEDTEWNDGLMDFSGQLTSETISISDLHRTSPAIIIPLVDFKELLISFRETLFV